MKHILIFTQKVDKNDPILGFFHRWIEEFSKYYEKVTVVCLKKGECDFPKNIEVKSLGKEDGVSRIKYLCRFYYYVIPILFSNNKPERIFVHMNQIYVLLLIPLFPLRVLRKISLYWWKAHGYVSTSAHFAVLFVDGVVTSSEIGFNLNTPKRIVIGQGIDTEHFCSSIKNVREKGLIVSVGRITESKKYEDLIEAARILKDLKKNVQILIVGPNANSSNDYFNTLKNLIDINEVGNIVKFFGEVTQDKLAGLYQRSDVLVNSSNTNSLDKVVFEAMACEVIPIVSNIAYQEVLSPYDLFLSKKSGDTLAEKIVDVLDMQVEEQQSLRFNLRKIVVTEHSINNLIKKIVKL